MEVEVEVKVEGIEGDRKKEKEEKSEKESCKRTNKNKREKIQRKKNKGLKRQNEIDQSFHVLLRLFSNQYEYRRGSVD